MKNILFSIICLLFISTSYGQGQDNEKELMWKIGLHSGSSMMWGDLSDDNNPLSKMFSNESKLSYELDLHRKISETFSIQGSFLFGKLTGTRTKWSDQLDADLTFITRYFDYSIALNMDVTALLGANPDRLISAYLLGGVGMSHYTAEKSTINPTTLISTTKNKALILPWGWGLAFNFTPRFSAFAQNTFRNTFVDDIDGHIGSGSEVNDIYSFTSIGVSYKFGPRRERKPQLEIVPMDVDTTPVVAEYIPVQIITDIAMPLQIKAGDKKLVKISIDKRDLVSKGEFIQTFPDGFLIDIVESDGGVVDYNVGKLSIKWANLPEKSKLNIAYKMSPGNLSPQNISIPGNFVYEEKGEIKVKQFKNNLMVEGVEVAKTDVPVQTNDKPKVSETPTQNNTTQPTAGIRYAVQIAAIYGGKMNPNTFVKKYKLNEQVDESSYKGYNNYTIGKYESYKQADERRKGTKVYGAYTVAFKNGQYQAHLYDINNDIMDQNPFLDQGITYKVQISASQSRPYAIVKLANRFDIAPETIYQDKVTNWYQYTVGKCSNMEQAKKLASELKAKGATDAYIVKFQNGKRTR